MCTKEPCKLWPPLNCSPLIYCFVFFFSFSIFCSRYVVCDFDSFHSGKRNWRQHTKKKKEKKNNCHTLLKRNVSIPSLSEFKLWNIGRQPPGAGRYQANSSDFPRRASVYVSVLPQIGHNYFHVYWIHLKPILGSVLQHLVFYFEICFPSLSFSWAIVSRVGGLISIA